MSIHSDAAQARIDQVRAMRQQIPNFVIPASTAERRSLIRAASVPEQFVELATVVAKNNPTLVRGGATDPESVRDLMAFAAAYEPVADELEALAHFVRHSITAARNKAGSDALTTYALARRLSKRPEHAELAPHVEDLRRTLRVKPRKPKEQQPAPPPAVPASPPQTS